MEGDGAALPVSAGGRGVWVDEHSVWKPGLRPTNSLPATTLETIAGAVGWDDVQEEDVPERRVQA